MRALAEFVLRGRREAVLVAIIVGIIPLTQFISPMIVGLVMLRKGVKEAALVLSWAVLPIAAWAIYPNIVWGVSSNLLPLLMLLAVSGLAMVLRITASWQKTLLVAVPVALLFELYLRLQPAIVETMMEQLRPLMEQQGAQTGTAVAINSSSLMALISSAHIVVSLLLLVWARWIQAVLFNPGGFRAEFHALRIEIKAAVLMVLVLLLAQLGVLIPATWTAYFALPLVFAGISLVHATLAIRKLSPLWLFGFYIVLPVIVNFLVLLALVDSWYDFRTRMVKAT